MNGAKEIELRNKYGEVSGIAVVDVENYDHLSKYFWHKTYYGYAARNSSVSLGECESESKKYLIFMHRVIIGATKDQEVDHIDRDRLNNRMSNLRIVTSSQNKMNQNIRKDNTSGFKGVTWDKDRDKWMVSINKDRRRMFIGRYRDLHEAAMAYNEAAVKLFGKYANLNEVV